MKGLFMRENATFSYKLLLLPLFYVTFRYKVINLINTHLRLSIGILQANKFNA